MGRQSDIFLKSEGEAWYNRNHAKIDMENDPILGAIEEAGIKPRSVFEVGCSRGYRLAILRDKYECHAIGTDPGSHMWPDFYVDQGTADRIDVDDGTIDLLIYGFCLYLCDREDLFKIVYEGDRVLQDGGYLVIWDFHPSFPHMVAYRHCDNVHSYKMDYSQLWLGNPAYSLFRRNMLEDETSVTILKKENRGAWPLGAPGWTP